MEVAIRKMGNSQGVLIPKPVLAQLGLEGTADLQVRDGVIEVPFDATRARVGLTTRDVWPSKAVMHWCGPSLPMRATTSWSSDEGRGDLAGATRPDGRKRDPEDSPLGRDLAQ